MEILQTLATIFVIGMVLYVIAGDAIASVARRLGVTSAMLAPLRTALSTAWQGLVWVVYRVIVGRAPGVRPTQTLDTAPIAQLDRTHEPAGKPRTDGRTDGVPAHSKIETLLQLDRSKLGAVKALVLAGWSVEDIRGVIKGANGDLGALVEQARSELNRPGPSRPELVGERADRIRREETTPAA